MNMELTFGFIITPIPNNSSIRLLPTNQPENPAPNPPNAALNPLTGH